MPLTGVGHRTDGSRVVKPPAWPERPGNAQDFDLFWLVRGLPPLPFPDPAFPYWEHRAEFGPPGTRWIYPVEALIARESAPGVPQATRAAISRLVSGAGGKLPPAGSAGWVVPGTVPAPGSDLEVGSMAQVWIRTAVYGTIGAQEEVVHVLNWKHSTQENATLDNAVVKAVGDAVRNRFAAFFTAQKALFTPDLTYVEVRSSALTQNGPGDKPEWPLSTQVSPFAANLKGTGAQTTLPYEVALGLSLNTNWRGTSRFRGRTYLGPLNSGVMAANGLFAPNLVTPVGASFGTEVVAGVAADTEYELHVISQKYGTSAAITGVRVGVVPDSQRRRRRDQVENYAQAWGTPVGGA
jgi:hypothetical protein